MPCQLGGIVSGRQCLSGKVHSITVLPALTESEGHLEGAGRQLY